MTDAPSLSFENFTLPLSVVSRVDISRMAVELERVDNEMTAAATRAEVGAGEQVAPTLSEQLHEFLQLNNLTLDNGQRRSELIKQVRLLKDKAPILHMTFAVTADRQSLAALAKWVREAIHPQAIISVGLQPGLVAGVYLRTANKVLDLSLKSKLASSRGVLVNELEALRGGR